MAAESDEFERAWAQIVADLTADDQTLFDLGQTEPGEAPGTEPADSATDGTADPLAGPPADPLGTDASGVDPRGLDSRATGHLGADPGPAGLRRSEPGSAEPRSADPRSADLRGANPHRAEDDAVPPPAAAASQPVAQHSAADSPAADPGAYIDGWEDEGHFTPPAPPDLPSGSPATRLGWAGALGGIATMILVTLTGWQGPRIVLWAAGLATIAGFVTLVWQLPESREDGWDDGAQL